MTKLKMKPKVKNDKTVVPRALAHVGGMDIKALLRKRGIYLKQRENHILKQAAIPMARELLKGRKMSDKAKKLGIKEKLAKQPEEPQKYISFTNTFVNAYWQKQIHSVQILEIRFDHELQKFIDKIEQLALNKIDELARPKSAFSKTKAVFDDDEEEVLLNQAELSLSPILKTMGVVSGQSAIKLTGSGDPYIPTTDFLAQVTNNVRNFTKSMIDTDQQKLSEIISTGIGNGDSIPQIRSSITSQFGMYSKMQATRISRTEVLRAANQSAIDAFEQSGVVEGKQWVTAGADDECANYEGQTVGLNGNFYSDTDEFADGDPPLHPNCRCIVVPVLSDKDVEQEQGTSAEIAADLEAQGEIFPTAESADKSDTKPEVYRGEGHNVPNHWGTYLGDALYVARNKEMASQFGEVSQATLPFSEQYILRIKTDAEYEKLVNTSIRWSLVNKLPIDPYKAIPNYLMSLGYKAAEISDEVDPYGGIGIVDPKAIKQVKAAMQKDKE